MKGGWEKQFHFDSLFRRGVESFSKAFMVLSRGLLESTYGWVSWFVCMACFGGCRRRFRGRPCRESIFNDNLIGVMKGRRWGNVKIIKSLSRRSIILLGGCYILVLRL